MSMNRRVLLKSVVAASFGLSCRLPNVLAAVSPAEGAEAAHREIWRRFIDKHGVMVDFTDLDGTVNYPTPEECKAGKPNALGWFQPIENGAMFNGLYMDAAIERWQQSKSPDDERKARKLMEGLLFLNSISDVKGFVGRGVSTDGKSHYAMGSNDQTSPWFFGLWRYWQSGPATPEEKQRIARHLTETAEVIVKLGWKMPAEPPFNTRGSFAGFSFGALTRRLFVARLMFAVTADSKWDDIYRQTLEPRGGPEKRTVREVLAGGMVFEYAKTHNWTSCCEVASLRGLWELESDAQLKRIYAQGLEASAALAAESLPVGLKFDGNAPGTFSQDWRKAMMPLWKPQQTEAESQALALDQLKAFAKISPRRHPETAFIREPISAAWIVTLCPNADAVKPHAELIRKLIARYPYDKLYYCTFFWAESAWYRLKAIG